MISSLTEISKNCSFWQR